MSLPIVLLPLLLRATVARYLQISLPSLSALLDNSPTVVIPIPRPSFTSSLLFAVHLVRRRVEYASLTPPPPLPSVCPPKSQPLSAGDRQTASLPLVSFLPEALHHSFYH